VLLSPEYSALDKFYRAEPEHVARLIECRPELIRTLTPRQIKELLDCGYQRHLGRVVRAVIGRSEKFYGAAYEHTRRQSFNEHGDVVTHHGKPSPVFGLSRFKFQAQPVAFEAIEHLNRFHDACRQRGVRVFYSHPPYQQRAFTLNQDAVRAVDDFLIQRLAIPRLDRVEEMVFPDDDFFDTEYHLNLEGKRKRSERVAASLARALKDTR
jgi:hypothetical protein